MYQINLEEKPIKSEPVKPLLTSYTDFRKYLKDFYNYKKTSGKDQIRPYSYKYFSAAADIKSPNYLKLIIDGQRNLSNNMIDKFARALQLNKSETHEFRTLVEYNQAGGPLERNQALKKLAELRVRSQIKSDKTQLKIWDRASSWVTWVLYNMVDQEGVEFTPERLQKQLRSRATLDVVKKSYNNLFESGELVRDESTGEVKKGRLLMDGSENISVEMVRKLQSELIYLGLDSLFQDEITDREFGAVTLTLTKKEFERLKFELRQLKKRFFKDVAMSRESSKGHRVYQLNIQFFPLTDQAGIK